ncbi:MAG TPA: transcriptional regulator, partial [Deltaproteobacteria bacterium]|nr:transcriptional regulator [Deltaproteobacteria bacterium]
ASLFPEPDEVEPLPVIEKIEDKNQSTEIWTENGELLKILNSYTYEIKGLDSDRIEIVPHRKSGRESGIEEKLNVPLDMQTQLSLLAEEGVDKL